MRVFERIRRNPVTVLAAMVIGLVGWIAAEQIPSSPPPFLPLPPSPRDPDRVRPDLARLAPALQVDQPVAVEMLPNLRPGMTRMEVEKVLGRPSPDALYPVTVSEGRVTYRTAYQLAEPDLPSTVRPIARPRVPARPTDPKTVVALEFDASKPGHPLLEVLYPDPLF